MRFHVVWRKSHEPEEAYRDFFETNDIYEAKDFAMRLAFDETNNVYVQDTKRGEIVRDFDALIYRVCLPKNSRFISALPGLPPRVKKRVFLSIP